MANLLSPTISTNTNAQAKQNAIIPYNEHLLDCQEITFKNSLNNFATHKVIVIGNFGLHSDQNSQIVYQVQDLIFHSPLLKTYTIFVKLKDSLNPLPARKTNIVINGEVVRVHLPSVKEEEQIQFILKSQERNDVHESKIFRLAPHILPSQKIAWFQKNGITLALDMQIDKIQDGLLRRHLFLNKFTSIPQSDWLQKVQKNLEETQLASTIIADRFSEWVQKCTLLDVAKIQTNSSNFSVLKTMTVLPKFSQNCLPEDMGKLNAFKNVPIKGVYFVSEPPTHKSDFDREKSLILHSFEEDWTHPSFPLNNQRIKKTQNLHDIITASSVLYERMIKDTWTTSKLFKSNEKSVIVDFLFSPLLMKGLIEFISNTFHTPIQTILDSYGNYLSRGVGAFLLPNTKLYVTCEPEEQLLSSYERMMVFLRMNGCLQELCVIPTSIEKANLREQYAAGLAQFGGKIPFPQGGFDLSFVSSPPLRLITNKTKDPNFKNIIADWQSTFVVPQIEKCWHEVKQKGFLAILAPEYTRKEEVFNTAAILLPKVQDLLKNGTFLGAIPLYSPENDPESLSNRDFEVMPYDIVLLFQKKEESIQMPIEPYQQNIQVPQQNAPISLMTQFPAMQPLPVMPVQQQSIQSAYMSQVTSTQPIPIIPAQQQSTQSAYMSRVTSTQPIPIIPAQQQSTQLAHSAQQPVPQPMQSVQALQHNANIVQMIDTEDTVMAPNMIPPKTPSPIPKNDFDNIIQQMPMEIVDENPQSNSSNVLKPPLQPTQEQKDFADNCFQ
jgi:hypothetical protein